MQPVNITFHEGAHYPQQKEFLTKLALEFPSWVIKGRTSSYYIITSTDGREIGSIRFEMSYSRTGDRHLRYMMRSHAIDNGVRGNSMTTINQAKAFSIVRKHFRVRSYNDIVYEKVNSAGNGYTHAVHSLAWPMTRGIDSGEVGKLCLMVNALVRGEQPDSKLMMHFRTRFTDPKFEDQLREYLLGTRMIELRPKIRTLVQIDGGYAFFDDDRGDPDDVATARDMKVVHLAFDMLPQSWQEKLGVLTLMKEGEMVLDTGYRHGEDTYCIVT